MNQIILVYYVRAIFKAEISMRHHLYFRGMSRKISTSLSHLRRKRKKDGKPLPINFCFAVLRANTRHQVHFLYMFRGITAKLAAVSDIPDGLLHEDTSLPSPSTNTLLSGLSSSIQYALDCGQNMYIMPYVFHSLCSRKMVAS